jgi:hypothetical protein
MRNTLTSLLMAAPLIVVTSCGDARTSHTDSNADAHDSALPSTTPATSTTSATPATPVQTNADSTSVSAAAAVIADFYKAIDAHNYADAYKLWSGMGAASNKTLAQFEAGFAQTAHVKAVIGTPGREDAAAGSRYVEVPVTLTASMNDGSTQRYRGHYVLRRAVVEGATDEQRSWRIYSAEMLPIQ